MTLDVEQGDLADVLARVGLLRRQLGWSDTKVKDQLKHLFQKERQALLEDAELLEWLQFLEFVVGGFDDDG